MYVPKSFELKNEDKIFSIIERHAFGQLISQVNGRLFSTHLPFLVSNDRKTLIGHMSIQNPQHKELVGQELLVTFEGAHDYVSPSWYASSGVPTWNYQAVHVYGKGILITNEDQMRDVVVQLSNKYESALPTPWEPVLREGILKGFVVFEIEIQEIQAKQKLSQNRSRDDQEGAIEGLKQYGSESLAKVMEEELG